MVHAKIVVPTPRPVMLVVGDREFVMVPLPETIVHTPVPLVAVFAAMVIFVPIQTF